jgi:hypothetical protein
MRRTLISVAAVSALGISATAVAQTNFPNGTYTPTNISIKGGVGLPLDSNLSNIVSTFIAVGGEFQLPEPLIKGGDTYFNLDWFTKSLGGTPSFLNLSINERWYMGSDKLVGRRKYLFLGAGMDFLNITRSDDVVAIRGGLGAELGENIFAEVAGYLGDQADGIHPDVLGVFIGYRF